MFSVLAWFAAAGHKFHYTAYIAEGKQASARKCNDYAQHIPIQQVMAKETLGLYLQIPCPVRRPHPKFLCSPPEVTNTS